MRGEIAAIAKRIAELEKLASSPSPRGIGISRKLSRTFRQVSLRADRAGKDRTAKMHAGVSIATFWPRLSSWSRNEGHVYLHPPFGEVFLSCAWRLTIACVVGG